VRGEYNLSTSCGQLEEWLNMNIEVGHKEKILRELEDFPPTKLPIILKLIRLLKDELVVSEPRAERVGNALIEIDQLAIETGITDLAENHDYYLYGVSRDE
jgi:hypothetical protein